MSKQLNEWSKRYDQGDIPVLEVESAMDRGVKRAKVSLVRRRGRQIGLVAFVSFWLALTLLINVSPTFANQLGNVPGMERLVEFFQFDRGKMAAVENNYYQPIGQKIEAGPFTFTIEGAIRDSHDIVFLYTLEGEEGMENPSFDIKGFKVNGETVEGYSVFISFGGEEDRGNDEFNTITLSTLEPIEADDLELDITFMGVVNEKELTAQASMPIKVEVMGDEKHFKVNETVVIEGQTLYIHGVTLFPLKVEVELSVDPNNTMRILGFDDLALMDESGGSWTKIENGMVGFDNLEDGGMKVYLQSNYFESPESLTLFFSKIQAVPKDADYLLIDLEREQILHDPYGKYNKVDYNGKELSITYDRAEIGFDQFLAYEMTTSEGDALRVSGYSSRQNNGQNSFVWHVQTDEPLVKLKLDAYPHWLEKAVHIKLY
ncbi:DUF4179 domain-containing protein [Amphibacillus cookii]|uniref:DUF4179 domain-containing protein n=1 Tax=Amphibacillus cookii TaxID=767787 RepID=UPI001955FB9B|nr:DUF4179 domain-containing protein [Amphibacillus cookii]MBM7542754.1 hypothetical protein [Amphibacillus cookii]